MSSIDDFAAESLAAERRGDLSPYFAETRPAARRLVRELLARDGAMDSAVCSAAPDSNRDGGALLGFLARVAAPIFGAHGAVAVGTASFAGTVGAVGATAVPPLAAAGAAAAALLGGAKGNGGLVAAKAASAGRAYVTLHFRSVRPKDPDRRWVADMRFPVVADGIVAVRLRVPRRGSGTFHFCGIAVQVSNGRAEFPLAKLRAALSRGGVAFARPSSSPVPGAPFLQVPEQ